MAKKLIVAAKRAGADAIKFQAFKADELLIEDSKKDQHFKGRKSVFEQVKSWELRPGEFAKLAEFSQSQKIIFFASVFGLASLYELERIGLPMYKISSADLDNIPLLKAVAKTKKQIIISTGMGDLQEISRAVKIFGKSIGILHCISLYPPLAEEFHLEKIAILQKNFPKHTIGFSDHSLDIFIPISAVVLGAKIIEKHLTLDKNMPGPDQKSSADPEEFKKMVDQIRFLEKANDYSSRSAKSKMAEFKLVPREQKMKAAFRRSIVSNVHIEKGVTIREEMLGLKRPGTGLSAALVSKVLGRKTRRDLPENTIIKFSDLI